MLPTVDKFLVIVITEAESRLPVEVEAARIASLLESGTADRVHLRCPDDRERCRRLLELIPAELRHRVTVHRFPELAREYGTAYHLRDGETAPDNLVCSRSCHSPADVAESTAVYHFLSPVYPSISKPGYQPTFALADLKGRLPRKSVMALGGVTPQRFMQLAGIGFAGAALLGYVWQRAEDEADFAALLTELQLMRRAAEGMHLQFITSAPDAETTASQACEAMAGGCRWVQVRMKDAPDSEVEQAVRLIAPEARRHGAVLIVDDRVELAARMPEIYGVHLGHNDMPRPEARVILGSGKIMGSTANTPEQALALAPLSDYLGVGPFRYTTTKKNLAPILGVEGLARVMTSLTAAGEFLPVVAIGGITAADIETVMRTGVTGVALSGVIIGAADPVAKTQEIIKKLHIHE